MEKKISKESNLHARNKNRNGYDLDALVLLLPELKDYIILNKYGSKTVDFANPKAVKLLNKALLIQNYDIQFWEFPAENLCPPIPGRADYLHYVADLLKENNFGRMPNKGNITALDIGTGASCIYPIIGVAEYSWDFIATDTDSKSLESAAKIIKNNTILEDKVQLRLQGNSNHIFTGILENNEKIDICICNPPFHESEEAAEKASRRKLINLSTEKVENFALNFSGNSQELIYPGGEIQFIENMIRESKIYAKNIGWFTTLVSKNSNLSRIYKLLDKISATQIETIDMGTGNKQTRIVAWKF
ncbi:23S rRNA (adenine(1618)-N(6))-methyltransferase RlmF [Frigoriflavimonas asaccharolytica]|uniref:Ribosomal RNA large subunit methyltransferase F n=1 Tax=Frigoriflavimonas asaccharolytica TaxID=2735899 RepID=A0A8J8KBN9_9FLAO|nr:23S rRNA (adenine(1618)-N(6))-methyltransferase RlmF [Frigoriflavimonas asaccharolytica]NRS92779.1 23S rRNA (adenine1618-N6)-methyltransferase [Frigoriflavimonas asaccharolytica]